MPERSKPRIAAYGLFTIDASGRSLRCWLDYKAGLVCCVGCVVPKGAIVWAYALVEKKEVLVSDLVAACTRAGYRCFPASVRDARRRLEVLYDVENHWPIRCGEAAGIKECIARPSRRAVKRRAAGAPRLPGC